MIDVLLAAPAVAQEPELVRQAATAGVAVLRRCVDAADLLAAAAAAPHALAVVSPDLPRLSADVVDRVGVGGRPVVGLVADPSADRALLDLGVRVVVRPTPTPRDTWQRIVAAVVSGDTPAQAPTGVWSSGSWVDAQPPDEDGPATPTPTRDGPDTVPAALRPGVVVAVWGPQGAPGRTTVALALADAFVDAGRTTCLVDADTYAPSVAIALGLDDTVSDLVVACRCADNRSVGPAALAAAARPVRDGLSAVGGLTDPKRWVELRPGALERLWEACRAAFDVTVVDVGFCLERDEDPGPLDRLRNAAAVTAVGAADLLVIVADASARGAARLGAAWPEATGVAAGRPVVVVRNRAGRRDRGWERAVTACGVPGPVVDLPDDVAALAACWSRGATLAEVARRSRLRRAVTALAHTCASAVG